MAKYHLAIVFKSNEHPWRNDCYEPVPGAKLTREDAISWAAYMQDNMHDYIITLFEDDVVLDYAQAQTGEPSHLLVPDQLSH